MSFIERQERAVRSVAASVPDDWENIELTFVHFSWEGELMSIMTCIYIKAADRINFALSTEALEDLISLNEIPPDNQIEKWTWLNLEIENSGKYKFDFQYGKPPNHLTLLDD